MSSPAHTISRCHRVPSSGWRSDGSPISFLSPTPPCGRCCATCAGSATGRRPRTSARTASWRTISVRSSGRSPAVSPYSNREQARALQADAPQRTPRAREAERALRAREPRHDPATTGALADLPPSLGGIRPLGRAGQIALAFALLSGLITHGYHLFVYPLYSTDEGIYVERAWSVIREARLAPQTYVYDHAPGGWLVLAAWEFVLPKHFEMFGNPVNSGRVLMLLLHLASVFFLFEIARTFSGNLRTPLIATFFFNFSPLALSYHRQVLLDNVMVFCMLLSIYLLLRHVEELFVGLWSGVAFGISVVSKENAIFFAPSIFYLLSRRVRDDSQRHFAQMFWLFGAGTAIFAYFLFATLKGELLPPRLSFNLQHPPQGHLSLLYELWYQIHRNQGAPFQPRSFPFPPCPPQPPTP